MLLYGRIEKIDELDDGTVKVHGIASTEDKDDQGEIVLASAMRDALPNYLIYPALREMHQLSAAGVTIEAAVGDDKVTRIVGHVVDPIAVKKVKAGVYRGFSIGGSVTKRDPANRNIISGLTLSEISLVDHPANPSASIEMWKAAMPELDGPMQIWHCGVAEHRHVAKAEAAACLEKRSAGPAADGTDQTAAETAAVGKLAPTEAVLGGPMAEALAKAAAEKEAAEKAAAAAVLRASDGAEPVWKAADGSTHPTRDEAEHRSIAFAAQQAAEAAAAPVLAAMAEIEGRFDKAADPAADAAGKAGDAPGDGSKPYGDVKYADPGYQADGKKRYPIDTERHIRAAWNYIAKPKNAGKYSAEHLAEIKAKIVAAWKSKIDKDGPPSADDSGKAASPKLAKALYDIGAVARIILSLDALRDALSLEAIMEGDESPQPGKLETMITDMCAFLNALVAEETAELLSGDEVKNRPYIPGAPDSYCFAFASRSPEGAAALSKAISGNDKFAQFKAALDEAMKAGARHSRADQAHLDLAYMAASMAQSMPGMGEAEADHVGKAMTAMKAAGAGEAAAVDAEAMHSGTTDTESGVRSGGNERAPQSNPPASEFRPGDNATLDTGHNARTPAPQVDPSGSGSGSNIGHIAAASLVILAKRHGGHQALLDVAHDCVGKMSDGVTCAAAKAGRRHSAETMRHLQTAHDHLVAAGGRCAKAANPVPGGMPKPGDSEAEGQGTEIERAARPPSNQSGDLAKMTAERDAFAKVIAGLGPQLDSIRKRMDDDKARLEAEIERLDRQPLQAGTVATGALPPGVHRIEKGAEAGTGGASSAASAAPSGEAELLAAMAKMTPEERTMLAIKAAQRDPANLFDPTAAWKRGAA